jgi:uncharacterized protein
MVVYENTIGNFINECHLNNIKNKISEKMLYVGFGFGMREAESWDKSLPYMARVLDDNEIDKNINVAIEYKFETSKQRIDFLIYGLDEYSHDSMVIVELKQWSSVKDSNKINYVHTFGGGGDKDYLHPSFQSYAYKNTLEYFNSYVQDHNVDIKSCSFLHNMDNIYQTIIENKDRYPFVEHSPVFLKDDELKLREFVKKHVKKSDRKLIYEIDNGRIRPTKEFSKMLYNALSGEPIFTLDEEQANSVATIVMETSLAIEHKKRRTIIIKGGPGSGKSVVAINALGQLIHTDRRKSYNVCYCTPNFTPKQLFIELMIKNDWRKSSISNLFKSPAAFSKACEFDYDCAIIDESHRAFKWKFGYGVPKNLDMIDKMFYASLVNVFFIDEDQVVTKDDYLTENLIKEYAKKYNSEIVEGEDLHLTSQFRCLGGYEYINFINSLLGYKKAEKKYKIKNYDFKLFDNATDMWKQIKLKQTAYPKSRLLAGYTHDWVSVNDDYKNDFVLDDGQFLMKWNKKVDYSYINDPEQFDRVGCIHTIQGIDMDYAGVIIGKDLYYENGEIKFNKNANARTDTASGIRNSDDEAAEKMIRNTYKVLLTRAIYGTYVYCEDKSLNEFFKTQII